MDTSHNAAWYIGRQGQQIGPFPWQEIQAQAADGRLTPDDLLWCDGMPDWTAARNQPGLSFAGPAPLGYSPTTLNYAPPPEMPYAGFWRRFAAVLIDGIVLWVVGFVVGLVIIFGARAVVPGKQGQELAEVFNSIFGVVAGWLYEALMISSTRQATLGKQAMGIIIIGPDGGRLSFGRSTGRYFGKILSAIILMIGYLMMLWTERKQTLHDMLAGTFVLNQPK